MKKLLLILLLSSGVGILMAESLEECQKQCTSQCYKNCYDKKSCDACAKCPSDSLDDIGSCGMFSACVNNCEHGKSGPPFE